MSGDLLGLVNPAIIPAQEVSDLKRESMLESESMTMGDGNPIPAAPVQHILRAAQFAAEKHASQKRKGQAEEPYINHVIEVALLIATSSDALDSNLVCAGLLHDTIEDTATTDEEIREHFGADVAGLVAEVTDNKSLPKEVRKALQIENAPHKSVRAQVIKLADKISNLRSILASPPAHWSEQRKREYFQWAVKVVAGLRAPNPILKREFDSLCAQFETCLRPSGD
jgi:guanosine-3',5'-bis(diphosphate) 3'-pyrophosphohydrolase